MSVDKKALASWKPIAASKLPAPSLKREAALPDRELCQRRLAPRCMAAGV